MSELNLSEERLAQAAAEVRDAILNSLPSEEECTHEFSPGFHAKMEKLMRISHRRAAVKKALTTVAAAVLVLLITSGVYLASNAEARADFVEWVRTTYENSIFYQFFTAKDKKYVLGECEFGWLPGGCSVTQQEYGEDSDVVLLTDSEGQLFSLIYMYVSSESKLEIAGDNIEMHEMTVNGAPAQLYEIARSGLTDTNVLVWLGDGGRVIFNLSAGFDAETMVRIAENITLKR